MSCIHLPRLRSLYLFVVLALAATVLPIVASDTSAGAQTGQLDAPAINQFGLDGKYARLDWNAVQDAGKYQVRWTLDGPEHLVQAGRWSTSSSLRADNLAGRLCVRVKSLATSTHSSSGWSPPECLTVAGQLDAAVINNLGLDGTNAKLDWNPVQDAGKYQVRWTLDGAEHTVQPGRWSTTSSLRADNLTGRLCVRVKSLSTPTHTVSGWSGRECLTVDGPLDAPVINNLGLDGIHAKLVWNPVEDAGKYQVRWTLDGAEHTVQPGRWSTTSSLRADNLTGRLCVRVKSLATSANTASGWSAPECLTVDGEPEPPRPSVSLDGNTIVLDPAGHTLITASIEVTGPPGAFETVPCRPIGDLLFAPCVEIAPGVVRLGASPSTTWTGPTPIFDLAVTGDPDLNVSLVEVRDETGAVVNVGSGAGGASGMFMPLALHLVALRAAALQANDPYVGFLGDVDCDGSVTLLDARLVAQYAIDVVGVEPVSGCDLPEGTFNIDAAEVDGQASTFLLDARAIAQCAIGVWSACAPDFEVVFMPDGGRQFFVNVMDWASTDTLPEYIDSHKPTYRVTTTSPSGEQTTTTILSVGAAPIGTVEEPGVYTLEVVALFPGGETRPSTKAVEIHAPDGRGIANFARQNNGRVVVEFLVDPRADSYTLEWFRSDQRNRPETRTVTGTTDANIVQLNPWEASAIPGSGHLCVIITPHLSGGNGEPIQLCDKFPTDTSPAEPIEPTGTDSTPPVWAADWSRLTTTGNVTYCDIYSWGFTLLWPNGRDYNDAGDMLYIQAYDVYLNGTHHSTVSKGQHTLEIRNLTHGATYSVEVELIDTSGNRSVRKAATASLLACGASPVLEPSPDTGTPVTGTPATPEQTVPDHDVVTPEDNAGWECINANFSSSDQHSRIVVSWDNSPPGLFVGSIWQPASGQRHGTYRSADRSISFNGLPGDQLFAIEIEAGDGSSCTLYRRTTAVDCDAIGDIAAGPCTVPADSAKTTKIELWLGCSWDDDQNGHARWEFAPFEGASHRAFFSFNPTTGQARALMERINPETECVEGGVSIHSNSSPLPGAKTSCFGNAVALDANSSTSLSAEAKIDIGLGDRLVPHCFHFGLVPDGFGWAIQGDGSIHVNPAWGPLKMFPDGTLELPHGVTTSSH